MEREKPYTAEDFVRTIVSKIELPEILDYWLYENKNEVIDTYDLRFVSELEPGGSEGIYADIGIEFPSRKKKIRIATFKTLDTDKTAYEKMGKLISDFFYEGYKLINENIDDFEWE